MARIDLHNKLKEILGSDNVYFQLPNNLAMRYPAIKYQLGNVDTDKADNDVYRFYTRYQLTYMDYDPDNIVIIELLKIP